MKIHKAIERMEAQGILLKVRDGQLAVTSDGLNDQQRNFLREHKDALVEALESRQEDGSHEPPESRLEDSCSAKARDKIERAIRKLADDALDWYRDDLDAFEAMPAADIELTLLDYLAKRDWYRSLENSQ